VEEPEEEEENEDEFSEEGSFCVEEGDESNDPRWQNVTETPSSSNT